jgi:D-glycero-D-manno-heptose 1,7-bisphosphate phosphatase
VSQFKALHTLTEEDPPRPAPVTLFRAEDGLPILPAAPEPVLAQVGAAGLGPERLAPPGHAPLVLLLPESGWESQNLAALVAFQQAAPDRPAVLVAPTPRGHRPTSIRAVPGSPSRVGKEPTAPERVLLQPAETSLQAVLLDRDGTIIVDRHYLADPARLELLPGAAEGLGHLQQHGLGRVVVTNQSGVARGTIDPDQLAAVHAGLVSMLGAQGVTLNGIYSCPHGEADNCPCRKPRPGLAYAAAADLGLDLARVVVVGDTGADLGLARALAVPSFLVLTGQGRETMAREVERADFVVSGLEELAGILTHPAGPGRPLV